jgi:hypothetical protein
MSKLVDIRRVIIITDTVLESAILEHIVKAGARGYNCVACFGRGRHEMTTSTNDPFTGRSRVRIEVLAKEAVATAIMDYIHEPEFASYPIHSYIDTVQIDARDESSF